MKALSIKQPWAWAIINLGKDVENRDWPTKFRGKFLIHTGKKVDQDGYEYITEILKLDLPPIDKLQTGGIVGISEIVDCLELSSSPWFFGKYGFVVTNARPIDFIPLRGQLGFFETGITV